MAPDVRAIVHDVLGSHGDETILDYIVGETQQQQQQQQSSRPMWSLHVVLAPELHQEAAGTSMGLLLQPECCQ
jgi:hypothetical protein